MSEFNLEAALEVIDAEGLQPADFKTFLKRAFRAFANQQDSETYAVGDTLQGILDKHLLVQLERGMVILVNLTNGNSWASPCAVVDTSRITRTELGHISGGQCGPHLTLEKL